MFHQVFDLVDLIGVLANAILGGVAAKKVGYDPVGFVVLAIVSGLGGGMIRDVLLQQGPPVALTEPVYLGVALVGAAVAFVVSMESRPTRWALIGVDAIAVGSWAAIGTQKGLAAGLPWPSAVMLGVITVVGGGIVRDVLLQQRPVVFRPDSPLYATCALVAATVAMLLTRAGHPTWASVAAIMVGAGMAVAARWFGWTLPTEIRPLRRRRSGTGAVHIDRSDERSDGSTPDQSG